MSFVQGLASRPTIKLDEIAGCQLGALLAHRIGFSWVESDALALRLLTCVLGLCDETVMALRAPRAWEMWNGPCRLVQQWAAGATLEPAREWAHCLEDGMAEGESEAARTGEPRPWLLAELAAHDLALSAYACALAILLADAGHFALNVFRMLRLACALQARMHHRGSRDEEIAALLWSVQSSFQVNALRRAFEGPVLEDTGGQPTIKLATTAHWREAQAMGSTETTKQKWAAARGRGFLMCQRDPHTWPTEVFSLEPIGIEREEI